MPQRESLKNTELSVQFNSVAQSCPTLCDPMNHSTPGLPVHHQFPESTQTHVHWVGNAIQPSHPLSSPSPPAQSFPASRSFQMSQLFTSGGQSIGVSALASFLPKKSQGWTLSEWTGSGTLKSLLQYHSSKASILRCSAFFFFSLYFILFFFKSYFIFKIYIIVLFLPNIKINPPQVYMCSILTSIHDYWKNKGIFKLSISY